MHSNSREYSSFDSFYKTLNTLHLLFDIQKGGLFECEICPLNFKHAKKFCCEYWNNTQVAKKYIVCIVWFCLSHIQLIRKIQYFMIQSMISTESKEKNCRRFLFSHDIELCLSA